MNVAELRDTALFALMRALPPDACSALGAALSLKLGQAANPGGNARARALLAYLDPRRAAAALDDDLRTLWQQIGRSFAEFAAIDRLLGPARTRWDGAENFDAAYDSGRPIVIAFVHPGHCEVIGAHVSHRRPHRTMAIVELPSSPVRARIAAAAHAKLPSPVAHAGPAVWRHALRHLATPGNALWLAADAAQDGICRFPAFGAPHPPDGSLAKLVRLAQKSNALILPLWSERQQGAHFINRVLPAFDPAIMTREQAMDRLEAIFAPVVRRHVTQWYMAIQYGFTDPPSVVP